MDGDDRKTFVGTDLHWPSGLTIDVQSEKLYWCDSFQDKIEWIYLTGESRTVRTTRYGIFNVVHSLLC